MSERGSIVVGMDDSLIRAGSCISHIASMFCWIKRPPSEGAADELSGFANGRKEFNVRIQFRPVRQDIFCLHTKTKNAMSCRTGRKSDAGFFSSECFHSQTAYFACGSFNTVGFACRDSGLCAHRKALMHEWDTWPRHGTATQSRTQMCAFRVGPEQS